MRDSSLDGSRAADHLAQSNAMVAARSVAPPVTSWDLLAHDLSWRFLNMRDLSSDGSPTADHLAQSGAMVGWYNSRRHVDIWRSPEVNRLTFTVAAMSGDRMYHALAVVGNQRFTARVKGCRCGPSASVENGVRRRREENAWLRCALTAFAVNRLS
jgi:hypothetical protein